MTNMAMPQYKSPPPPALGVVKFTILVDASLVIITMYSVYLIYTLE